MSEMAHVQVFEGVTYRQIDRETAQAIKSMGGVVYVKTAHEVKLYLVVIPFLWWHDHKVFNKCTFWVETDGNSNG